MYTKKIEFFQDTDAVGFYSIILCASHFYAIKGLKLEKLLGDGNWKNTMKHLFSNKS